MSRHCPDGHPSQHVAVVVPLVPGRPFEVVHRCVLGHTWEGPLEWNEPARDEVAVRRMAQRALEVP